MANEFKVKKGLIVSGSGGTLLDVQGSVGQVLSITDSLTGDIFSVSDVSGIPIFNVNSNGTSYFDGNVCIGTTTPFTTGGTANLTVAGNRISWGASNTDMSYFRRLGAGEFQWQTYNSGNTGEIHLQPYGGNVGIGTTSPSTKFHVRNGEATIASDTDGVKLSYSNGNSSGIIDTAFSDNNLEFRTNGTAKMWISNAGNVGIGTTSPSSNSKLEVIGKGDQLGSTGFYINSSFKDDTNVGVFICHDDTVNTTGAIAGINQLSFITYGGTSPAWGERMKITGAGNVGIGTTSPLNRLFVTAATAGDYAGFIENTNATNGYGLVARTAHTGTSAYAFAARAGTNDIFVVRGDGNVGIGTPSPGAVLSVRNPTAGTSAFSLQHSTTSSIFDFQTGIANVTGDALVIKDVANSYDYLTLRGGNVAIGDTSSNFKLKVQTTGWNGIQVNSTTTNGAVLNLTTTQRAFELASRGNGFEIRDLTAGDTPRLTIDSSGNATFAGDVTADNLSGTNTGDQDLSPYTTTNGSGDEWKFTLGDESSMTGNKWYKVAQMNQGSGGLHIKGYLSNHVEGFGTQKVDLAIQGRETNTEIEISGTVDVLHNSASGTDKVGIRVIKSDTTSNANWHYWDVYIRTTRYTQAKFHLVKMGATTFYTAKPSVTSEPAPVSGGTVELDTSTLLEGQHVIVDSAAKLHVAAGGATVTGSITATGDVIAYSDARLKENVKTLDGSKVLQMRGVSFDRKDTGISSSGVIAQEMQKIAPELVSDDDGTLGVAYGNLTGYLIEAIKDLKTEVEQLKKLIKKWQ